ncbi:unnamed protein product [Cuscuta epithymum]|uniref:Uncharacterized protein n=1 Tax=Cuscuta epithymum TaxID=186058 RepID=A0AAV0DST7_9ASTE|nr:unnamed protein product [Cuscuta epithymum]
MFDLLQSVLDHDGGFHGGCHGGLHLLVVNEIDGIEVRRAGGGISP